MEMQFILTGAFDQHAGDIDLGPCEIEVIFSSMFLYAGIYGTEGIEKPVNHYLPSSLASYFSPDITL